MTQRKRASGPEDGGWSPWQLVGRWQRRGFSHNSPSLAAAEGPAMVLRPL